MSQQRSSGGRLRHRTRLLAGPLALSVIGALALTAPSASADPVKDPPGAAVKQKQKKSPDAKPPGGQQGSAMGTVTDADGAPIQGASVAFDGEFDRTVTTNADGQYSAVVTGGDYTVTASAYGYASESVELSIPRTQPVTQDFSLEEAQSVPITGTVTDGSGQGWPLYAKVNVEGDAPDTYTDPATGEYEVNVPAGTDYSITFEPVYPGYETVTEEVSTDDSGATVDVEVPVDVAACVANGYQVDVEGETETFDATSAPEGWTIVDNQGNQQVWRFDNPKQRANLTGGEGNFAIADSDYYGSGGKQNTSLVSPVMDMSAVESPAIGFRQDYRPLGDKADVDLSLDGGQTWETVLAQTAAARGPRQEVIQIPQAVGKSEVQVRFHYYDADYNWWWEVDDFFHGSRACVPTGGGMVVGEVNDNDGKGVSGATVVNKDDAEVTATTEATPDDENLGDGFYWLYDPEAGTKTYEASKANYQSDEQEVAVNDGDTAEANFTLGSASLSVTPKRLRTVSELGSKPKRARFTLTNDGTAPADVEFSESEGDFVIQRTDGSRLRERDVTKAEGAPVRTIKAPTSLAMSAGKDAGGKGDAGPSTTVEDPWTPISDLPTTIMDNRVVNLDGIVYNIGGTPDGSNSSNKMYAYDPATLAWTEKASLPVTAQAMSVAAIDGKIIVSGGWLDGDPGTGTYSYDPGSDSWSEKADAPAAVSAAGYGVVDGMLYSVGGCTTGNCTPMSNKAAVYDPGADSWSSIADYPEAVAFASCGGVNGKLYCTGGNGGGGGTAASYVYDPAAGSWSALPDAPAATWASGAAAANGTFVVIGGVQGEAISNETFGYDAAAGAWVDLPNANTPRYRGGVACGITKVGGSSGNFNAEADAEQLPGYDDCGTAGADVDWLKVNKSEATLDPGESVTVTVTMDPKVAQPGKYTAGIQISSNAPGRVGPVTAIMVVKPPKTWGKLAGVVKGKACPGTATPLADATVRANGKKWKMTFATAADGSYAYWVPVARANPVRLIAAKDGYVPQTKRVKLIKRKTVTANFTLKSTKCG